ncbi:ABC transporter permease [Conexibacter stalactiti]|uniref:ABC transporter permease n=1 Tax=Conexibacter stalactiti TaxID=1940611 RepID=A0ABU4HM18_9ACTN|nr:ABC transporter permease [Conexibacter stalactiti]MDW5593767.1 ABC transporter permease [Conexibacter stalactiti]MEC5034409.1 ABC transporter permease [Conexibacter stalactiti]
MTLRLSNYSGLVIWAALIALFAVWVPDTFLTSLTVQTLASEQAVTAIIAIGLLPALAAGAYDLSVGAMLGLSAIIVSSLTARSGVPLVPAILITLAIGAGIGAVNAFLVVGVGINSFIATLAMSSVLIAPARAISHDQIVSGVPHSLTALTEGRVLGLPAIAIYMLAIAAVVWYLLEHTPWGRRVEATGAGPEAARLAGVRTGRMVFGSLVTSALLSSCAGILLASKLSTATPDLGPAYLLPAFAAAFLGTTQIKPGKFNVVGTLIAIFLLATGVKGLQLAGAADWVTDLFNGLALIIAVGLALWGGRLLLLAKTRRGATQ